MPFNKMKNQRPDFLQRLHRLLRRRADRHNPWLLNRLAAFNFGRPLQFPGELLARYREFAQ
jgi:hypothetical protein